VIGIKAPAPAPKRKRKRTEETRGCFFDTAALRFILRIIRHRPPPQAPWDAMQEQHFWGEYFWATECADTGELPASERPQMAREFSGFSPAP
jgi:hypothetical protein